MLLFKPQILAFALCFTIIPLSHDGWLPMPLAWSWVISGPQSLKCPIDLHHNGEPRSSVQAFLVDLNLTPIS